MAIFKPLAALCACCLFSACLTPARLCASVTDCGSQAACVAGRCLAHGATPAIGTARRLLFAPVDTAYVRRDTDEYPLALAATLGRTGDRGAALLLRFSASIPPDANVLEAYLLLERVTEVEADPAPIVLHALRIADQWDSRSVSWARQPRARDIGAPATRVFASAGPLVRLDVRLLVQRWRRRTSGFGGAVGAGDSGDDFGVAVFAETTSSTGVAFALGPGAAEAYDTTLASLAVAPVQAPSPFEPHLAAPGSVAQPRSERVGPRLELYVK